MWEWGAEEYRWRLRWVLLGEVQDKMDRVVGAVASGLPQIDGHSKRLFSSGDASSTPTISRAAMTSWWSCMSRCVARDGIDVWVRLVFAL
jgi:hypothetical protein